jgi:hypothetical protein
MQVVNVPGMWGRALYLANGTAIGATDTLSLYLPFEGVAEVILMMTIPSGTQPINTTVTLNSYSINSDHKVMEEKDPLRFTVNVTEGLASVDAISSVQGAVDPLNMGLEELQASWRLNLPGKGYSHLIARP